MSEKQNENEVETSGAVGEVYTTQTGMNKADPYEHSCGWEQISLSTRVQVESVNLAIHDRFYVWRRVSRAH